LLGDVLERRQKLFAKNIRSLRHALSKPGKTLTVRFGKADAFDLRLFVRLGQLPQLARHIADRRAETVENDRFEAQGFIGQFGGP
jgi:hypothetical protein